MTRKKLFPDFIFESSWEVCNKVGGIYAVLSTRAKTLQERLPDHLLFIGPDCWNDQPCPVFTPDATLYASWQQQAAREGLRLRVGRWEIPGRPVAILVDFTPYYAQRNEIYAALWQDFQVDSLHGYGDYDEASMFSYAAALVVESFCRHAVPAESRVVYHGNEWMTGLGLLYIRKHLPRVATVFTTHATSIGRSIAGNDKPLYEYLAAYNGDQMAQELNMQSKHSIEKQTAHHVDCFTTVSDITARECAELLDRPADVVLPNGFEDNFVPRGADFTARRRKARRRLLDVASALTGCPMTDDTLILATSGRYEWRNKGIDVFIEAMHRLGHDPRLQRPVVAFIEVPGWVAGPRADLQQRLAEGGTYDTPLDQPVLTHWLHNMNEDRTLGMMRHLGMNNAPTDRVKVIFVPCYLVGDDGIMNMPYYDAIMGNDLSVYPSYYEPWGYTPLESVAFKVPAITTDLAGFGLWVNAEVGREGEITDGVKVIHRTDYNYADVADAIRDTVVSYAALPAHEVKQVRERASRLARKALWSHFIAYYEQAYDVALTKAAQRSVQPIAQK